MSEQTTFRLFPTVREGYRPDESFEKQPDSVPGEGETAVTLSVKGDGPDGPKTEDVEASLNVYGPGEVTSLDTDQIVRMEPEPDTTEFAPNYFPLVEFDNPRLPWQFSPERADDQGRTRPWLCLVVVPRQRVTLEPPGTGALPVLETATDQLPDAAESWAWAHGQLVGDGDADSEFRQNSTKTVARLVCPRNLDPQTRYRACVVPTFEPGRRAGLGLDPYPEGRGSVDFAWSPDQGMVRLPVYHYWEFTSAKKGDFEYLARELEPQTFEGDVGFRTVDVSNPGPQRLKPETGADTDLGTVGIGGALKAINVDPDGYHPDLRDELQELLNKPATVESETDYGAVGPPLYGQFHAGVPELEDEQPWRGMDGYYYPVWFNTLNKDPRHRIAAGYGTEVIQHNQEGFMESAWEQFGEIQEANRKLKRAQFAERIQERQHQKLDSLSTGTLLGLTQPIHGELLDEESGETVYKKSVESDLPSALASPQFRRITRPEGPLARRDGVSFEPSEFATRLETGRIPRESGGIGTTREIDIDGDTAAGELTESSQPMTADQPPGEGLAAGEQGGGQPAEVQSGALPGDDVEAHPGIERLLTLLDSVDAHAETAEGSVSELTSAVSADDHDRVREAIGESPTVEQRCVAIASDTFSPLTRALSKLLADEPDALPAGFDRDHANDQLQSLRSTQRELEAAIDTANEELGAALDRAEERPESAGAGRGQQPLGENRAIQRSLDDAERAIERLRSTTDVLRTRLDPTAMEMQALSTGTVSMNEVPAAEGLPAGEGGFDFGQTELPAVGASMPAEIEMPNIETLRETTLGQIDPAPRLYDHVGATLGIPNLAQRDDPVEEIMAAPTFTDFTYELLAELNQEYFLPGAGDIPKNSMGVLQTNPTFIESYLAGLNHEMARELRWRRYPTDRRGTYLRRFWDRRGNPDVDPTDPEEMADIRMMHNWDENDLGENSPRDDDAKVVLLIKGELLRRYPNTDVFAAKAVDDESHGPQDTAGKDRVPALPGTHVTRDIAEGLRDHPDVEPQELKYPVFRGKLEPDITFFGFDITPDEALYDPYHLDEVDGSPDDHPDEGWFFVLQEPPAETRFGLDVGEEGDVNQVPAGITTSGGTEKTTGNEGAGGLEHGVNAVSWAHLVGDPDGSPDDVTHVDVSGSPPGEQDWSVDPGTSPVPNPDGPDDRYQDGDAATWGYNSAHMARFTWQLPVRVSIHADDMITEDTAGSWRDQASYNLRYLSPGELQ